jgi:F-type H+-transporting ATPase subunit delta
MSDFRIANRYAEALLTAAEEQRALTQIGEDLAMILRITRESRDLQLFLKSPVVNKEKKLEVLEAVFASRIQPLTLQFIRLLTEKAREGLLPQMIEAFFRLQDSRSGTVNIAVNAASNLSEEQKTRLAKRFETFTEKKVRLQFTLDKRLIGGFVARVGDVVLDGSVKRQLETLRRRFVGERTTA